MEKSLFLFLFFHVVRMFFLLSLKSKIIAYIKVLRIIFFFLQQLKSKSNGVSFGFCHGYCRQSINVTSIKNELIALKEPNYIQDQ